MLEPRIAIVREAHQRVFPIRSLLNPAGLEQVLRVPPTWQHQIDLACLAIRSKAYSDQAPQFWPSGRAAAAVLGICQVAPKKIVTWLWVKTNGTIFLG